MKKTWMMLLLCLLIPSAGTAEEIAQLAAAMGDGVTLGLREGIKLASAVKDEDLTLALQAGTRIEEGQKLTLTLTAGNPREEAVPVTIELKLPERLGASMETTWQALLPAGKAKPDGSMEPSVTTFTREIAIVSGETSEQAEIEAEMAMGSRFYRAKSALTICMSDVAVTADIPDAENARVEPGETYTYEIEVTNAGLAAKDVPLEIMLPGDVELAGEIPDGFVMASGVLTGQVRAEAAQTDAAGAAASRATISLPVRVRSDALEGDKDASKLIAGMLKADGERVAMPRVQVCAPRISARLVPETDKLEAGEEMDMHILVVNAGLADAEVEVSCMLPDGLMLVDGAADARETEATPQEAAVMGDGDAGAKPAAAAVPVEDAPVIAPQEGENNTLVFSMHMDAAKEDASGVTANTQTFKLRVRAEEPQEDLHERMLGAALCWSTDDGQTQLGEAVALKVYDNSLLGVRREEWSGIFWAGILLIVTVIALYSAVHSRDEEEDYCCE